MKTINLFFLFMLSCVLVVNTNAAIPNIDNSDYYIAMSFDGNDHDKDDILAMPMALALVGEACLQDKLVHVDYSNHIWGDIAQSVTRMRASNTGAVSRWNHDASIMFEVRIANQLNAAKANFKQKANMAFNQNSRLYYACGGPMHVPYLCVTEVPNAQRNNITCISHSKWNDNHKHGNSKTWSALANTGVKTVARGVIGNQNQTAFNQSEGSWSWLNQMGGKYSWLFSRNFKSSFDASDAGMTWYIITGRGDKKAGMANVKDFFQKYNCGTPPPKEYTISASVGSGNGSITPSGNVKVTEGGNKTFTISAAAGST
ncbi:MAG: hypothetical protein MI922_30670, partial [Bacteroidales bacterium]|nr:hypothetical protein [Bacteroidales bacterium]